MKIHYVCAYRLKDEDLYLIWYNSKPDGVVVDETGLVPAFRDRVSLRDYARSLNLFFDGQDEIVDNLDTLRLWLQNPERESVNCVDFLNAWNLFADIARSVGDQTFDNQPQLTNTIYEKLFWGNNIPGITVIKGERLDPTWSQAEVETMRRVLEYGLQMFQERVKVL